ncbi:MAG: DUF853 family protein [Actinomyces sp.]|nr:MAG: DUF853 family protein [Actinomyces sp.]
MDTSTVEVEPGHLLLGPLVDPTSGEPTGAGEVQLDAGDLTTHGVIVGMTGSGKTGLGVCLVEEARLAGLPTLVIDPKGDMGNLALVFPELRPDDFRPWIDEAAAEREGLTPDEYAARIARTWEEGLAGSGIGRDRLRRLRDSGPVTIYTPGSTAGVPLDVIGDLSAPADTADPEAVRDEIEGLVGGLLGLVGVRSDPLSGREHVLLANLVERAWTEGRSLDLAGLIAQVQNPPLRKLGVIDLDTFFPPDDRTALALRLNGLLASPSFAAWTQGAPLDIASLLWTPEGDPACAVVSIAHLSDDERQFAVALLLSRLVTWMRSQAGTSDLRVLVYMDEVFGFVPPTERPPAKKPILTLLKQARAYGVGLVLATQNPVDLDYKAISNAGTWLIGRLQTERDKARLLEGMRAAAGDVDLDALGDVIGGLGKRRFLLHSTGGGGPTTLATRWAMSYLAGPLTRDQIARLTADDPRRGAPAPATAGASSSPPAGSDDSTPAPATDPVAPDLADDESLVAPDVADGVAVAYLDPAAGWASEIGADPHGTRLEAAVAFRVALLYDDTAADLRHEVEWEAVLFPLGDGFDPQRLHLVDLDDRDLGAEPPSGAVYALPEAKIHTKTFFRQLERDLRAHLYRSETITLWRNASLKLYSRPDESREEFLERCRRTADERADEEADELRRKLASREDRLRAAIAKAEDRVRELESEKSERARGEVLSGALDVIGGLLGGRRSTRSILGGIRRATGKRRMTSGAAERLRSAKRRLEEKIDDLEELAAELTDSLAEIQEEWEEAAADVTEHEVGLEKSDISVTDVVVVWVPVS